MKPIPQRRSLQNTSNKFKMYRGQVLYGDLFLGSIKVVKVVSFKNKKEVIADIITFDSEKKEFVFDRRDVFAQVELFPILAEALISEIKFAEMKILELKTLARLTKF